MLAVAIGGSSVRFGGAAWTDVLLVIGEADEFSAR